MGFSLPAGGERGDLQHFPAITRHGVWDRRQNIGFFFFSLPFTKQIQYFLILLRGSCRAGEPVALEGQPCPTEELRRKLCAPIAEFPAWLPWCQKSRGGRGMVKAGEDQRQGPGSCFPALGVSCLALGTTWEQREHRSPQKPPSTGGSWREAVAGLEQGGDG